MVNFDEIEQQIKQYIHNINKTEDIDQISTYSHNLGVNLYYIYFKPTEEPLLIHSYNSGYLDDKITHISVIQEQEYIRLVVINITGTYDKNVSVDGYILDKNNKYFEYFQTILVEPIIWDNIDITTTVKFIEMIFNCRGLTTYVDYNGNAMVEKEPLKNKNNLMNKKTIDLITNHLLNHNIIKKGGSEKKKLSIIETLLGMFYLLEMDYDTIEKFILDINNNNVINLDFFKYGGDLYNNYINSEWVYLCKSLYRQRPIGLGTPNAMVGEGELMFLFISNYIKKKKEGDLTVEIDTNKSLQLEIKGEKPRVMGDVSGREFKNNTLTICNKFGLIPNNAKIKNKNIVAVELEKSLHLKYWSSELQKLDITSQREFIYEWLNCISSNIDVNNTDLINIITDDNVFNQMELIKIIIKKLYNTMIKNHNFDALLLTGNDTVCRLINNNSTDLINKINSGIISIKTDYFRINQSAKIGWYIE